MNLPTSNHSLDLIFKRRSIRAYTSEPVEDSQIRRLLEAAMAAPSACAKDPWRFIVIRERSMLQRLAAALPHGGMLANAAAGIVVCGDVVAAHDGQLSYLLQDCSAAIENVLLAATAQGLGCCWLGVHPREDRIRSLTEILKLPPHILPISAIAVGHPAEQKEARSRFREDYVHLERW